tara:strand:- start:1240 stop:1638 length:399 start_codon:yes stop_codon:yes gene_type:complete
MTSVLNVDTVADKAGTGPVALTKQQTIKSHVRFNMQADTITGSFNISSCTDNGSGESTNTLTNAMNDANYTVTGMAGHSDGTENNYIVGVGLRRSDDPTTTYWRMQCAASLASSSSSFSPHNMMSMISGDLA